MNAVYIRLEEAMRLVRLVFGASGARLAVAAPANAQAPEKKDIVLGVGGKALLYYLPLTLAERLGYFKEQGLNVTINDFAGGSRVAAGADRRLGRRRHRRL